MSSDGSNGFQLGAGLAGAGGGTGLIAVVNIIPNSSIKDVVIFLAPSAAIVVSMLWIYCTSVLEERLADRRLAMELSKAEQELDRVEADPGSSVEFKAEMRSKVEALRLLKLNIHTKRVTAIIES